MKDYIRSAAWLIVGGLAMFGFERIGKNIIPKAWALPVFWLCAALLVAIYALSVVQFVRGNKKTAPDVAAEREDNIRRQEELEKDSSAEKTAIARLERSVWLLWVGVIVLHALIGLCSGAAFDAAMAVDVLCMFTMGPMLAFVLRLPKMVSPAAGTELSPNVFPELFGMTKEVAAECGHTRKLRLFIGEQGIGVFRGRNYDGMLLPALLVRMMTKSELRQVMRHEFSHLTCEETKDEARWLSLIVRMEETIDACTFSVFGLFVLLPAWGAFRERVTRYRTLIEKRLETEADAQNLSPEEARDAVAAIAKSALFNRFCEEDRVSAYRCFESETPRKDQVDIRGRIFDEMLAERGKIWLEELEREQPAQFDSHPTFAQRRGMYGVTDYDAFSRETDGTWLSEMRRLCDWENAYLAENPDYDALRKHQYVDRRAAMEAYEGCDDPFAKMDTCAIVDAAEAYFGLNTPKALEIVRKLIEKDPQDLEPKLLLGLWLLDARDDNGMELLYQVAKNGNYTERALSEAGNYAFRRGDAGMIADYRSKAAELLQYAANFHYRLDDISMSDLRTRTMPDELLDLLVNEIVRLGEGFIRTVACAAVDFEPGEDAHVFVLEYADDVEEEKYNQIHLHIFELLDYREEHYSMRDDAEFPIRKLEKQIPGCVVYKNKDR